MVCSVVWVKADWPLLYDPVQLEDCILQLASNGTYLDLELTLAEQREVLEAFYDDIE